LNSVSYLSKYGRFAHDGISTNNAEGMILNMDAHKNNWGGAKIICRIKKRVHEMESSD
jgi:hypothetical protein